MEPFFKENIATRGRLCHLMLDFTDAGMIKTDRESQFNMYRFNFMLLLPSRFV